MLKSALAAVIFAGVPTSIALAEPSDTDRAVKLRGEAVDAAAANDFETCKKKALEAFAIAKQPEAAGLAGICEAELHDWPDAAAHLSYAIKFDANPARQPKYQEKFNLAQPHVFEIDVTAIVEGTTVLLDGKESGLAPTALFVNPGHYVLKGAKEGYTPIPVEIDGMAGAAKPAVLDMKKKPPPPAGRTIVPGVVGLVVGVVAIGIGGGLAGAANGQDAGPDCMADCDAHQDQQNKLANASAWMFISGGTVAIAGGALLGWALAGPKHPNERSAFVVVPAVTPTSGGVVAAGRF